MRGDDLNQPILHGVSQGTRLSRWCSPFVQRDLRRFVPIRKMTAKCLEYVPVEVYRLGAAKYLPLSSLAYVPGAVDLPLPLQIGLLQCICISKDQYRHAVLGS